MKVEKALVQQQAMTNFFKFDRFMFCNMSMGSGKTKLVIDIIKELYIRDNRTSLSILYVASGIAARNKTVPDQFHAWDAAYMLTSGDMTIIQPNELDKYTGCVFDFVIHDEVHKITPRMFTFYQRNVILSLILLTGSEPDNPDKKEMIRILCRSHRFDYSMAQAMEYKTVNNIKVTILQVAMTGMEIHEYQALKEGITKAKSEINKKGKWVMNAAMGRLAQFIHNSESKLKAAEWVVNNLRMKGRRFIVFTAEKAHADRLGPYRKYSGRPDTDYKNFEAGHINELMTVKQLQDSANIPNLLWALLVQLNSKTHNFEQYTGRLMRGDSENDIGNLFILCLMGTADERWVKEAIAHMPASKIERYNVVLP